MTNASRAVVDLAIRRQNFQAKQALESQFEGGLVDARFDLSAGTSTATHAQTSTTKL